MIKKISLLTLVALGLFTTSCYDDDVSTKEGNLELDLVGLEPLGSDYVYEGWIIVEGIADPISTGTFSDLDFPKVYDINAEYLDNAKKFVLSIEPANDDDPAPSNTKVLSGTFSSDVAVVTTGIVGDFNNSSGQYIIATPTDGEDNNENSGIWFLNPNGPSAGLNLPTLDEGWKYEGWVVIDGTPVSTGTFTSVEGNDDSAIFSGSEQAPPFPGEDFLLNAPEGLTFPTDITEATAVISVEPYPDNSPAPFTLKPLISDGLLQVEQSTTNEEGEEVIILVDQEGIYNMKLDLGGSLAIGGVVKK